MSKRSHFTKVTPLPAGISRKTVLDTLHSHTEMIDLNPLVIERHPIRPPSEATPEEAHCQWYCVRDKITYIPGLYSGELAFSACFHDLPDGLQTRVIAPLGLDMRGRWILGGTLPGEPRQPVEMGLGVPKQGLWLREDVDMKCNMMMTSFVKKTTKKAHETLVHRLIEKSHLIEGQNYNQALRAQTDGQNLHAYPNDTSTIISSPSPQSATFPPDSKFPPISPHDPPAPVSHPAYRHSMASMSDHGSSHNPQDIYAAHGISHRHSQGPIDQPALGVAPALYTPTHQHRRVSSQTSGIQPGLSMVEMPAKQPVYTELPTTEHYAPVELDSSTVQR